MLFIAILTEDYKRLTRSCRALIIFICLIIEARHGDNLEPGLDDILDPHWTAYPPQVRFLYDYFSISLSAFSVAFLCLF